MKLLPGVLRINPDAEKERVQVLFALPPVHLDVDQSVRHATELVFTLFRQLGSVRGVLNYLAREGLELPSQHLVPVGHARNK